VSGHAALALACMKCDWRCMKCASCPAELPRTADPPHTAEECPGQRTYPTDRRRPVERSRPTHWRCPVQRCRPFGGAAPHRGAAPQRQKCAMQKRCRTKAPTCVRAGQRQTVKPLSKEKVGVPRSSGSQPTFAVLSLKLVNASSGPRCRQVLLQSRLARRQLALEPPPNSQPPNSQPTNR
jgi:hypothetical protein